MKSFGQYDLVVLCSLSSVCIADILESLYIQPHQYVRHSSNKTFFNERIYFVSLLSCLQEHMLGFCCQTSFHLDDSMMTFKQLLKRFHLVLHSVWLSCRNCAVVGKSIVFSVCHVRPFVLSSRQILLPQYLMNGLSNLDDAYREYSLDITDDIVRFCRSKVKVTPAVKMANASTLTLVRRSLIF